ncbi:hypothetical protein MNBD_GAMMA09-118 [hydrothermal vent metagenome]|uniref:DUF4398 domain-containing protein n=1 Tax=hydrothermal vent metagenome TaxID=652676 RepID=A0A3B0Y6R1_9ZZZZ
MLGIQITGKISNKNTFNGDTMNHTKLFAGLLLAGTIITGCANSGSTVANETATPSSYQAALTDAQSALKKAKKANYEWRDSGKMLKKAAKAAKAGDYETAVKLAKKAQRQGEMALVQSKEQANAGPRP